MLTDVDKKNAVWNSATFVYMSIIGFISFTLTLKTFDSVTLGLFILFNSILNLGNNLDFGFGISTIKHIAEAKTVKDYKLINSISVSFFFIYMFVGFVITGLLVGYYFLFLKGTELVSSASISDTNFLFFFLAIAFFIKYLTNYFRSIIEGFSKFILVCKLNIATVTINFILIFFLYIYKLSVYYLVIIYLAIAVLGFILFLIAVLFFLEEMKPRIRSFSFAIIKKYSIYGLNIQLSFIIGNSIDVVIKYIIGSVISLSYVTFYETAKKVIDVSNGIIFSALKGLFNKLSEYNVKVKLKEFIDHQLYIYSKIANYYNIAIYGIANPLICAFILIWFKYYEAMIIFLIFIIPYSLISIGGSMYSVFMVEGKGKLLLLIQSINVVTVFIFLYISTSLLDNYIGLISFYGATIISIILLIYFLRKNYEFNYKGFLKLINFKDLVLLNGLLLLQLMLLYLNKDYVTYILIAFQIVYLILFFKYLKFFANKFKQKILIPGFNKLKKIRTT